MKYSWVILRTLAEGFTHSASKFVINTMPMYHFLVVRYFIIFIMSYATATDLKEDLRIIRMDKKLRLNLLYSSGMTVFVVVTFYSSLAHLPVSIVISLNYAIYICTTALIGAMIFGERKSNKFYLLMITLIPTTLLVIVAGDVTMGGITAWGMFMLFISSIGSAFEAYLNKRQVSNLSIPGSQAVKSGGALIAIMVITIIDSTPIHFTLQNLTWAVAALVVFSGLSSFLRAILTMRSTREIGVATTTVFTCLTPIFSIVFAVILLNESVTLLQWLGVIATVVILYLIMKDEEKVI